MIIRRDRLIFTAGQPCSPLILKMFHRLRARYGTGTLEAMTSHYPILTAVFLLLAAVGGVSPVHAASEPIRHFADIRSLARDIAAMALPVEIEGVVVWSIPGALVVHDGVCGIYVTFWEARAAGLWRNDIPDPSTQPPGTRVKITGVTNPGGFAPVVLPSAIERLGSAPMPPARRLPVERLLSGGEDGQYVELEGVVQGLSNFITPNGQQFFGLKMMTDGHPCLIAPVTSADSGLGKYLDARIRVRGVLAPTANLRAQNSGIKIGFMSEADVEVLRPPPADPFSATRVELDKLLGFAPDSELFHRKVTTGVVAFAVPDQFFYLQNDKASVRVEAPETGVRPGDKVDVAGFIDTNRMLAALKGGEVRVLGHATAPPAVPVTIGKILRPELRGEWEAVAESDYDGRVVQLDGILRRVVPAAGPQGSATLLIEADETLFENVVPVMDDAAREVVSGWLEGSTVVVTGLCELDIRKANRPGWFAIEGFTLLLADPGGLRVLRAPPWWTPRRSFTALAATVGVLALILAWSWTLRRRVKKQSGIIGSQLQQVAVQDERARIARDMHDEIGGKLARLSVIGEMAANESANHGTNLQRIRELTRGVREAAGELEQIIWSVDPCHDTLDGVAHRVFQFAEEYFADTPIECHFGEFPELPDVAVIPEDRADLIAVFRESITNVLKHSGARHVEISVAMDAQDFEIRVSDDGRGFDASTTACSLGNGLTNMKTRMQKIGGELFVESTPGHGTILRLRLNPFTSLCATS
jgi:signal transduction histidine kinase